MRVEFGGLLPMTWMYNGNPVNTAPDPAQALGFVYEIYDTVDDRYYIGKKVFWNSIKLRPLKGKKNSRHQKKESDWRDYYGSNETIKKLIEAHGKERFSRKILVFCRNKTELSYWETRIQFERDVLRDSKYYNDLIHCRITSKGLK